MPKKEDQRPDGLMIDSLAGPEGAACQSCVPTGGPVREKGGTTGAENLSPGAADRTGGASAGVSENDPSHDRARKLTPDP